MTVLIVINTLAVCYLISLSLCWALFRISFPCFSFALNCWLNGIQSTVVVVVIVVVVVVIVQVVWIMYAQFTVFETGKEQLGLLKSYRVMVDICPAVDFWMTLVY